MIKSQKREYSMQWVTTKIIKLEKENSGEFFPRKEF